MHAPLLLCAATEHQLLRTVTDRAMCTHSRLLQVVSSKVFQLIEILGSHSITVKDLRALLVAMRSDRPHFSPQRTLQVLNSLQTMAQITGPEVYFHFTGVNSAIVRN
jgi:hypothetical protein